MSLRWVLCFGLTPLLGFPALAQSVISAHAGLVHFSDGSVFLDDQRVEQKPGRFEQMKNGSELRTGEGRAEVLLTPGTFLRMGANSAIRMVSNDLDNTRVELLRGSAVLDQGSDATANTAVTILYNLDQVHIQKAGRYRFDSEPPQVKVESGEAEVMADGKPVQAGAGYVVALEGQIAARRLLGETAAKDNLANWNSARERAVADGNQDAAATSDLAGVIDGWQRDPDAVLQSLGIAPYPAGMSSYIPPYSYGSALYGPGLYGTSLYGTSLGYGAYGFGVSPLALYYGTPLYLPYRYPGAAGYRGSTLTYGGSGIGYHNPIIVPGRIGTGGRGIYQNPSIHLGPIQPTMGRPGVGIGVGHAGAMHGGHH
jgi:hypothetical protein